MFINVRQQYSLTEDLTFFLLSSPIDVRITVYDTTNQLYIYKNSQNEWVSSQTVNYTDFLSTDFTSVPPVSQSYLFVRVPNRVIRKNIILLIKAVNLANNDETFVYTQYGTFISTPGLVTVYGNLFDATANPLANTAITFSIINPISYFDNSLTTNIHATVVTDNNGSFSIQLNRQYDYIATVPAFNLMKVIRLSRLPSNIDAVELRFENVDRIC